MPNSYPRSTTIAVAAAVTAIALAVLVSGVIMALAMAGQMNGMMGGMMGSRGSDGTSQGVVVDQGSAVQIAIRNFAFVPGNISVRAGAKVTWTNEDDAPHNATDRAGGWETDTLSKGDSGTLTFDTPGTYEYFCTVHPSMRAALTVRER
jgi:plastocyanin